MNKRGEEENHWSTISAAVFIILAMVVVLFVFSDSFAEVKKGFEKFADKEAIGKAYKKTIGRESTLTEEEKKVIDKFNLFFKNNFIIEDDDCIKQINFYEIKGKGFGISVRDGNVFAEKEERARVYPLIAPSKLALYSDEVTDEFFIDENFEKINNKIELADFIYIKEGKINFLDRNTANFLFGSLSDVIKKNICGEQKRERLTIAETNVMVLQGTTSDEAQDIVDYLNSDFFYLGSDYKLFEILAYLNDIPNDLGVLDSHRWEIDTLLKKLEEQFGNYFENYGGDLSTISKKACWRAWVTSGIEDHLVIIYGTEAGISARYRSVFLELSDGRKINFDLDILLDFVTDTECLPTTKTANLERNPLAKGAFKGSTYSTYSKNGYID